MTELKNASGPRAAMDAVERRWLLGLLLLGLLLRLGAILAIPHAPVSDELSYQHMALSFLSRGEIRDDAGNWAFFNAGYPLLVLAPVWALFGHESLLAVRLVHVALGLLSIVMVHRLAAAAGAGRLGRLAASAAWALYLPTGVYAVYLAKENLLVPLMLGLVWCALRFAAAPSYRVAAMAGLLLGLTALVGNAGLCLLAALLLGLAWAPAGTALKLRWAGLIVLVAGLLVAPWMLRNQQVLGAPVLNTNGGFNLYIGNNPQATGLFVSIADTPQRDNWQQDRRDVGELQASQHLAAAAKDWIRAHPADFMGLALKKALLFWTPPVHSGQGTPSRMEELMRQAWAVEFVLMAGLALLGLLAGGLRDRRARILWLAVLAYTGVHMLFYVIYRYRLPIMPIVAVLAALSLERLVQAWQHRRSL